MEWHFVVVLCAILFFAFLPLPAHAMEIHRGRVSNESFSAKVLKGETYTDSDELLPVKSTGEITKTLESGF